MKPCLHVLLSHFWTDSCKTSGYNFMEKPTQCVLIICLATTSHQNRFQYCSIQILKSLDPYWSDEYVTSYSFETQSSLKVLEH